MLCARGHILSRTQSAMLLTSVAFFYLTNAFKELPSDDVLEHDMTDVFGEQMDLIDVEEETVDLKTQAQGKVDAVTALATELATAGTVAKLAGQSALKKCTAAFANNENSCGNLQKAPDYTAGACDSLWNDVISTCETVMTTAANEPHPAHLIKRDKDYFTKLWQQEKNLTASIPTKAFSTKTALS